MTEDLLEQLNERLESASVALGKASTLIKHTQLDYRTNFDRVAEALATILAIQLAIFEHRPDLRPDHLKPEWNSSAPPDAVWKRAE